MDNIGQEINSGASLVRARAAFAKHLRLKELGAWTDRAPGQRHQVCTYCSAPVVRVGLSMPKFIRRKYRIMLLTLAMFAALC